MPLMVSCCVLPNDPLGIFPHSRCFEEITWSLCTLDLYVFRVSGAVLPHATLSPPPPTLTLGAWINVAPCDLIPSHTARPRHPIQAQLCPPRLNQERSSSAKVAGGSNSQQPQKEGKRRVACSLWQGQAARGWATPGGNGVLGLPWPSRCTHTWPTPGGGCAGTLCLWVPPEELGKLQLQAAQSRGWGAES